MTTRFKYRRSEDWARICRDRCVYLGLVVCCATACKPGDALTTSPAKDDAKRWCEIRRGWAKEVNGLAGDIALAAARTQATEDGGDSKAAVDVLLARREATCARYAAQVQELSLDDVRIQAVEKELIKEGKVRANIAVELANGVVGYSGIGPDGYSEYATTANTMADLRRLKQEFSRQLRRKIADARRAADQRVGAALAKLPQCKGIYRGPLTTGGTSSSPYISWGELEVQRRANLASVSEMLRRLEPYEELGNRVYHTILSRHRSSVKACYRRGKRAEPALDPKIEIQVRLKRNGNVRSLALRSPTSTGVEQILDCMLNDAAKWRLPKPSQDGQIVRIRLALNTV